MKRVWIAVTALVVLTIGGAGLRLWTVARSARASPFECLATAGDGWLTISADGTTLHADWKDGDGHIDGVTTGKFAVGSVRDEEARRLAVELTAPFTQAPKTAHASAKISVFALCDGVPRSWAGTSVTGHTLRSCLSLHPRTVVRCVRDVVMTPAPLSQSEAWEVAKKIHALGGGVMPADDEDTPLAGRFAIPHWRGPADDVE